MVAVSAAELIVPSASLPAQVVPDRANNNLDFRT